MKLGAPQDHTTIFLLLIKKFIVFKNIQIVFSFFQRRQALHQLLLCATNFDLLNDFLCPLPVRGDLPSCRFFISGPLNDSVPMVLQAVFGGLFKKRGMMGGAPGCPSGPGLPPGGLGGVLQAFCLSVSVTAWFAMDLVLRRALIPFLDTGIEVLMF